MIPALHAFPDQAAEARRLADALQLPLAFVDVHRFPDGETAPRVPAPALTTIVYRSLYRPNDKIFELLLAVDAWRRNGAQRLVLVTPYLPYMRQDIAFETGEPVSQRVVANLLDAAFDRIITVDPHLHRTSSLKELFPTSECTHLHGADALIPHLRTSPPPAGTIVVGPDVESAPWVRRIAEPLGLDHVTLQKQRHDDTRVDLLAPAGFAPNGRPVLLADDICSTGGTLRKAVLLLKSLGAGDISIFVTHALGGDAVVQQLRQAGASRVISTDSCPDPTNEIHLASLLAEALDEPA